jgi:hypothetical protein
MARPVIRYDEELGGNLKVRLIRHEPDEENMAELYFKRDYVAIRYGHCPDCSPWPYEAIFPTLYNKIPLVALFPDIGSCGRTMVENELIANGIIVIVRRGDIIGSRIGEFVPLPDTLAELLGRTKLVEKSCK